jgi:hypothetical protein
MCHHEIADERAREYLTRIEHENEETAEDQTPVAPSADD